MNSLREAASISRNFGLDTLRTIAILLVLFCHGLLAISPFPGYHTLFQLTGFLGVEIFFVLSGYLIGSILLTNFQTEENLLKTILNFWKRRWFRTIPNYVLFLGVNLALVSLSSQLKVPVTWPLYFIFSQKIVNNSSGMMPESWSLAVEEWFYLFIPLIIATSLAVTRRPYASYLFGLATIAGVSLLLRSNGAIEQNLSCQDLRVHTLFRLDAIAYGGFAAALMRQRQLNRQQIPLLILGLLGIGASLYLYSRTLHVALPPLLMANIFTINSISIACILPFTIYSTKSLRYSKMRHLITWISIISYSLYLVHLPLSLQIVWRFFPKSPVIVKMGIYLGSCVVIAALVYEFYERPMTKLRDRMPSRSKQE